MNIRDKLNKVIQTAWENEIELKGIILAKKHKKEIDAIVPDISNLSDIKSKCDGSLTIIYK